jgi:dephospho-CoA kinase
MLKAGITGGIGSGKSLVATIFSQLLVPVFSADAEAAHITNTHREVIAAFKELFGDEALDAKGFPDRKKLRPLVFNNAAAREKLNMVIHPLVKERFDEWCREQNGAPLVLKEAAILFESGADIGLDKIMVVTAPEALRIKRVMTRDKVREEDVRKIMQNQMTDEERLSRADFEIVNDDDHPVLPQVLAIFNQLKEISNSQNGV